MIQAAKPEPIDDAPRDGTWIFLIGRTLDEPAGICAFWAQASMGADDAGWYASEAANSPVTAYGFEPTHFLRVVWP